MSMYPEGKTQYIQDLALPEVSGLHWRTCHVSSQVKGEFYARNLRPLVVYHMICIKCQTNLIEQALTE